MNFASMAAQLDRFSKETEDPEHAKFAGFFTSFLKNLGKE